MLEWRRFPFPLSIGLPCDAWKYPPLLIPQPKHLTQVCQATSFNVKHFPAKKKLTSEEEANCLARRWRQTCGKELLPSYLGSPSLQGYPSVNLHELKYLLFILP